MTASVISKRILEGISDLWETRVLSDVTIKADDMTFPAHRTILALSCDYFMAMLTSNMVETTSNEIELKGIPSRGLEPILRYIYTGNLTLTENNVCDVIMAAAQLQMDAVLESCSNMVNKVIRVESCVELKNIAKLHCLQDIEYLAEDFILDHFAGVMIAGGHCGLDLRAFLMCFFHERSNESDAIVLSPESKVFSLVLDWIKYNEGDRNKDVARIMEVVRFPLMTLAELDQLPTEYPTLLSDSACAKQLDEARTYLSAPTHSQVLIQSRKNRIRNNPGVLVLAQHSITRELQMYALCLQETFDTEAKRVKGKWLHLSDMEGYIPDFSLNPESVSFITINDFLILVGVHGTSGRGDSTSGREDAPTNCYIFNPRTSNWTKLNDLRSGRHLTALVFHEDRLYALGGAVSAPGATPEVNSATIESYDFRENAWGDAGRMPAKLRHHAACSIDDHILICGGRREGGTPSYAVYLFDPKTRDSHAVLPLMMPYEKHQLHNINDGVYMVLPKEGALKAYQAQTDSWNKFWVRLGGPSIPHNAHAVRVGSNVIFIDGRLEHDSSDSDSEDDESRAYQDSKHACVEVVVGDVRQGAGRVYVHDDYPAILEAPVVLAGIRLPWHLTNRMLQPHS